MINTYICSSCRRPIGIMLGKDGKPELFKCPNRGDNISQAIRPMEAIST